MPRVPTQQHQWQGATWADLDEKQARKANNRGKLRFVPGETVTLDVCEVACAMCRKSFDDVADQPCSAYEGTEHLRGGPIGERAKRKHPYHDCAAYDCHLSRAQ